MKSSGPEILYACGAGASAGLASAFAAGAAGAAAGLAAAAAAGAAGLAAGFGGS